MEVFDRLAAAFQKFPFLKSAKFPEFVRINEVGPRDGLQYENAYVDTPTKVEFINLLTRAQMPAIECTSYISAQYALQMADSRVIAPNITKNKQTTSYQVFAQNIDAVRVAKEQDYDEIVFLTSPCKEMVQRTMKCSLDEMLNRFKDVVETAKENELKARAYIACVMGSKDELFIDPLRINDMAHRLLDMGCYQVALADNLSLGTPERMIDFFKFIDVDRAKLAVHFHDSKLLALENILIALSEGISTVDGSASGLGQCIYNMVKLGNIPSEDVLFMLDIMGIKHGIKYKRLLDAGDYISERMGRENLADTSDISFEDDLEEYKSNYKNFREEI